MMKRVIWRANQVISIETRRRDENRKENVYVLAQMINRAQLLVFNLFNTDNNWENIDLNKAIDIIKENIPNHKDNEIISKDMIIALEEYGRIK